MAHNGDVAVLRSAAAPTLSGLGELTGARADDVCNITGQATTDGDPAASMAAHVEAPPPTFHIPMVQPPMHDANAAGQHPEGNACPPDRDGGADQHRYQMVEASCTKVAAGGGACSPVATGLHSATQGTPRGCPCSGAAQRSGPQRLCSPLCSLLDDVPTNSPQERNAQPTRKRRRLRRIETPQGTAVAPRATAGPQQTACRCDVETLCSDSV